MKTPHGRNGKIMTSRRRINDSRGFCSQNILQLFVLLTELFYRVTAYFINKNYTRKIPSKKVQIFWLREILRTDTIGFRAQNKLN